MLLYYYFFISIKNLTLNRGGMATLVFVAHSVIYAVGCPDKCKFKLLIHLMHYESRFFIFWPQQILVLKASSDINDQRGLEFVVNFMFLVALVVYFGRSLEVWNSKYRVDIKFTISDMKNNILRHVEALNTYILKYYKINLKFYLILIVNIFNRCLLMVT